MVQCSADINVPVEAILDNDLKEVEDKKNMIRYSYFAFFVVSIVVSFFSWGGGGLDLSSAVSPSVPADVVAPSLLLVLFQQYFLFRVSL